MMVTMNSCLQFRRMIYFGDLSPSLVVMWSAVAIKYLSRIYLSKMCLSLFNLRQITLLQVCRRDLYTASMQLTKRCI